MSKLVIRKYRNRRLYNPDTATYVTAQALAEFVKKGVDFVVVSHATGDDVTSSVLLQIFLDLEDRSRAKIFSAGMLRQLISLSQSDARSVLLPFFEQLADDLISGELKFRLTHSKQADPASDARRFPSNGKLINGDDNEEGEPWHD